MRWAEVAPLSYHGMCCDRHIGTPWRCQEKRHTRGTYNNGCRCEDCRRSEREYRAAYRARKAAAK